MIWINGSLALFSLLAVFKAPARPLWFVAIGVTEWGHYLAMGSLALAWAGWRWSRRRELACGLALAAAALFLSPLVRSIAVARLLPAQLAAVFGQVLPREGPEAPARPGPLRLIDLFRGVASPPIRMMTVVYPSHQNQLMGMDLYLPGRPAAPLPGVIVIHGGSWQGGDRGDLPELNRYLAARGYIVAAIDYRLAPQATFPAQRDDVFTAISFLKLHARELGLDPHRMVVLGRSAGGQIALSAAYAQKEPAIKGVIAFYAPNDLVWGYALPTNPLILNSRKMIEDYLGGPPAQKMGIYDAASPLRFVNPGTPPTLTIHGVRDELVWALHDTRLSKRMAQFNRPYLYLRLPWATHGCDANFNGPCGQLSTYAIERFLAAVVGTPPAAQRGYVRSTGKLAKPFPS